ncbi:hypothetical protein FNAPI_734 [Fusarium napiforme]|uniref:Uncharacterized protein n=1 Tax=Fusarium napiforme TaxID=42672 RepID=A0A8H5K3Z5_9HYPO|nr:hypothetical protein FNAPI_734 [Fusarium napiforme]
MRVIWNGEMTRLADVVALQMILDNAHTWATRVFKPLIASYIEQWQHVFDEPTIGGNFVRHREFSLSKQRRERTVEQRRAVVPMVQSLLDDQSTMELDDMASKKVTPLLLGLMMHQICSLEKDLIISEVDRVVSQKLEGLSMMGSVAGRQYSSQRGDNARSRAHSDCYSIPQDSIFRSRQYLQFDIDDPNDSDYRPSQDSSASVLATSSPAFEPPRSDAPVTLPSAYEFSFNSSARVISKRPETQPPESNTDRLFDSSNGDRQETPSTPGGQVTPKPSPSPLFPTLLSTVSTSPGRDLSRDISKETTPSGLPVITGLLSLEARGRTPEPQLGQANPLHPHDPLEGYSEKDQFQGAGQDECDYIDLTRDSQEDTSQSWA